MRTRGIQSLPDVLQFPFVEGYQLRLSVVTAQGMAAAAVVAGSYELGRVQIGPVAYRVLFERQHDTHRAGDSRSDERPRSNNNR